MKSDFETTVYFNQLSREILKIEPKSNKEIINNLDTKINSSKEIYELYITICIRYMMNLVNSSIINETCKNSIKNNPKNKELYNNTCNLILTFFRNFESHRIR
jgi:hypothetical protein